MNGFGRTALVVFAIVALLALTGCAPGPNSERRVPDREGDVAGFWLGLWQGIIVPITFVVSLFNDRVNVYEVHNNGGWYNFGFVLGAGVLLGGSAAGSRKRRR